jgi:hypothetical protein
MSVVPLSSGIDLPTTDTRGESAPKAGSGELWSRTISLAGSPVYKAGFGTGLELAKEVEAAVGFEPTHPVKEFPFKGTGFNHFPTPPQYGTALTIASETV